MIDGWLEFSSSAAARVLSKRDKPEHEYEPRIIRQFQDGVAGTKNLASPWLLWFSGSPQGSGEPSEQDRSFNYEKDRRTK